MSARFGFPSLAGTAPDAAAALPIGSQIEAHTVLQVLSEGPFGFVYLTRDDAQGATRVLKEFMPRSRLLRLSDGSVRPCDVSDSIATSVARIAFMNEANTLASFQHPALIRVLGVIPANRTLYRLMPLVDGVSLEQHCRTRTEPPTLAWLAGLVEDLLQAVQVLHERRVAHGCVQPQQVMVRESGQALLLGFASVARELDNAPSTPWQSPAAAHITRHAPPNPADDFPALAATAFFAATGIAAPTLQQRRDGVSLDVRQALADLPDGPGDTPQRRRGLIQAIEAGLALGAEAQPQTLAEFRRLLVGEAPLRGVEPTPRWVGAMPHRGLGDEPLISQPAPLADDAWVRPAAARPPAVEPGEATPPVALGEPVAEPPAANTPAPETPPVSAAPVSPTNEAPGVPEPGVDEDPARVVRVAQPVRVEPGVETPSGRGADERVEPVWLAPAIEPAAEVRPIVRDEPIAAGQAASMAGPPAPAPVAAVAAPPIQSPPTHALPEPRIEPNPSQASARERVRAAPDIDFAATEIMAASADGPDASSPDTEPFIASLPPPQTRRSRLPAIAAALLLGAAAIGLWWWTSLPPIEVISVAPSSSPPVVVTPPPTPAPAVATAPPTTPPPAPTIPPATPSPVAVPAATTPTANATPAAPATPAATAATETTAAAEPPAAVLPAPPAPPSATAPGPEPATAPAVSAEPPRSAEPPAATGAVPPPAAQRPSAAAVPAVTARSAAPPRTAARSAATSNSVSSSASTTPLRPSSPLAACGNRTRFSLVYCMQQQCSQAAYRSHPQCVEVRNGG